MADPQNHLLITVILKKCPRDGEAEMLRCLPLTPPYAVPRSPPLPYLVYGINSNLLGPTLLDLKALLLNSNRNRNFLP
jgi:hypothetical protein